MTELFDCKAGWDRLTPEVQREIGTAAIVAALGSLGSAQADSPAHYTAEVEGMHHISRLVSEHLLPASVTEPSEVPRPDLGSIGIRSCHSCGCTDESGCEQGCYWVGPNLCSACCRP